MKVVINGCFGGFGLSDEAKTILALRGVDVGKLPEKEMRCHKDVVEVVELLGSLANATYAELRVVEVPDDVRWHVADYDGNEWVAEDHRTWS